MRAMGVACYTFKMGSLSLSAVDAQGEQNSTSRYLSERNDSSSAWT